MSGNHNEQTNENNAEKGNGLLDRIYDKHENVERNSPDKRKKQNLPELGNLDESDTEIGMQRSKFNTLAENENN